MKRKQKKDKNTGEKNEKNTFSNNNFGIGNRVGRL